MPARFETAEKMAPSVPRPAPGRIRQGRLTLPPAAFASTDVAPRRRAAEHPVGRSGKRTDRQGDDPDDRERRPEYRYQGSATRRPAASPKVAGKRRECRREDDPQDERDDDDRYLDGGGDGNAEKRQRDEQPPAELPEPVEPDRDDRVRIGQTAFRFDTQHRDRCVSHGQDEGDHGDRREQPDDPGQCGPRREGDQCERRMDVHGLVIDDRREELALDDVQDRDQDQQDQGGGRSLRCDGDDQEDDRRHQPADVRDEPAKEDDDRERAGQGHAKEDQEESLRGTVERGDDGGPAQVSADPLEGDVAARRDRVPTPRVRRREHPDPRLVAVHHEEERQERAQDRDRREGADVGGHPMRRGREPALDAVDDPIDREPDLRRDGQVREPRLERRESSAQCIQELGDIRHEREADDDQGGDDDQRRAEEDDGCCPDPRPAAVPQREHVGSERRRNDRGEQDRSRDGRQFERDGEQDQPEKDRRQKPPADGGESHEPAGDEVGASRQSLPDLGHLSPLLPPVTVAIWEST